MAGTPYRPRMRVYAVGSMPPGIRLKHAVLVAAVTLEDAARALRVTPYHLRVHRLREISSEDARRALAMPGQRVLAGGGME